MIEIFSKENKVIKNIKKLKEKRYRDKENLFIVEGFRFAIEAINSSFKIHEIFIDENEIKKTFEFKIDLEKLEEKAVKIYKLSSEVFKSISSTANPQGILCTIEKKEETLLKNFSNHKFLLNSSFFVLVDKVQDPGNLGTIIRSSLASFASGIILTQGTVDIYNEKVLRSTMGAIFKIPIIYDKDLEFTKKLKE